MNKKPKHRVDPVEVFCRIRPLSDKDESENCVKPLDDCNLMLQIPESSVTYKSGQCKQLVYSFTQIYDEDVKQKQLYDQIGFPLVQDCLNGKNGLLFTYGVTGSGKTYTMIGNPTDPGLLQRCLDSIFNSIGAQQARKYTFKPDRQNAFEMLTEAEALLEKQKKEILPNQHAKTPMKNRARLDTEKMADRNCKMADINESNMFAVFISCIEIYNNYIYDLFDDQVSESSRRVDNKESKLLKEDTKGCMYIKDSVEIEVRSTEEALELMHKSQKKRVVACTDLNAESSRSHSIFTIRIVQAAYDANDDFQAKGRHSIHVSQLSLVDLAGSERTKRTKNTGCRLKEAGNINSSLMALRNCMEALRENIMNGTKKIVPYRDSKLTLLFKNYFEGNGKIKMILCINPSVQEFDETLNVLKFSDLVKDILVPVCTDIKAIKTVVDFNYLNIINNLQSKSWFSVENFPSVDIYQCHDDKTILNVIDFLEEYNQKRQIILADSGYIYQQLFIKMRELTDENERLREENLDLKYRLDTKDRQDNRLESKIKALERVINIGSTPYPKENRKPSVEIDSSEKRHKAKDLETFQTPTYKANQRFVSTTTTSTTKVSNMPPLPTATPTSRVLQATAAYNNHVQQQQNHRMQSPVRHQHPRDGVPVANRRAQRRSKSVDLWLNHKPANTIKTDTVLQPKLPSKRSVTRVELDDAKKSTKYVLTHQQQDSDGEIVTNLIKGDILTSPSGGANVIFTDFETLRVQSESRTPKMSRKRVSDDVLSDPFTIEERCSMGIEGHGKQPRFRNFK